MVDPRTFPVWPPLIPHVPLRDAKRNVGHHVQEEYADFVNRHAGVVDHVKLVDRKVKPSAVQEIHPIMCQYEEQKPNQENFVVYYGTPQKRLAHHLGIHHLSPKRPIALRPLVVLSHIIS
jgi:hypothetical protein